MHKEAVVMVVVGEVLFGEEQIGSALRAAGFRVRPVKMAAVEQAIALEHPALLIANLSGARSADLEDCLRLARWSTAPLIAIGPAGEDAFRAAILEAAADDYLTRPVNPHELAVRAKNILPHKRLPLPCSVPAGQPGLLSRAQTSASASHPWVKSIKNLICRIFKRD